jgi:hypothetical protein
LIQASAIFLFLAILTQLAESQVVLNTLKEDDFQDAFKKIVEAVGSVHIHKRGLF